MNLQFIVRLHLFISFLFNFFFPFEVFWCTECKFALVLRTFFFFKHKLHAGKILNFGLYLPKRPKTLEIDRNDPKFFQSEIGTPWTKFLESPLAVNAIKSSTEDTLPIRVRIDPFGTVQTVSLENEYNTTKISEAQEYLGRIYIGSPTTNFVGVYRLI